MDLNTRRIFSLFITHIKFIVLAGLVLGLLTFGFTKLFIKPTYTTETKHLVLITDDQSKTSEASFIKQIIADYIDILDSGSFFDEVADYYNASHKDAELTGEKIDDYTSVYINTKSESNAFYIKVSTNDAEFSYRLAEVISYCAVSKIDEYKANYGYNAISKVDGPKIPISPSSPDIIKNVIIGVLVGMVLSAGIILTKEILDTRVKNLEDINNICTLPILGVIPDTDTNSVRSSRKKHILSSKEE